MSENLKAMVKRKELLRKGGERAEEKAEEILQKVLASGGLTTEEVYALMAY